MEIRIIIKHDRIQSRMHLDGKTYGEDVLLTSEELKRDLLAEASGLMVGQILDVVEVETGRKISATHEALF